MVPEGVPGGRVLALAFAAALGFFVTFAQLVTVRLAAGAHGLSPLAAEGAGALFALGGILGCLLVGLALPDSGPRQDPRAASAGLGLAGLVALGVAEPIPTAAFLAVLFPGGLGLGLAVPRVMRALRGAYGPTGLAAPFALATAATYALANGLEAWRGEPAGVSRVLAAVVLGASAALAGLGPLGGGPARAEAAPPDPELPGWAGLAAAAGIDSLGFGIIMYGPLAAVTFMRPGQLAFNALTHAAGAGLGLLLMRRLGVRRTMGLGLALMGAGALALGLGEGSPQAGLVWSLLEGLGVGAYHVPYFATLAGGPGSERLSGLALGTLLAGWIPAGFGLATGRLLLLVLPDPLSGVGLAAGLTLAVAAGLWSREAP